MSAIRDAIVLKLQADTGVGSVMALTNIQVYPQQPPEGATYPCVQVMAQAAPKAERVFQQVSFEESIYIVKAIAQDTSPKSARAIADRIRTVLDNQPLTITGYTSMGVAWMQQIEYSEEFNGQIFQHEGGLYSVMASL